MNPYLSIEGVTAVTFFLVCALFALSHSVRTANFTTLHFSIVGLATFYGLGYPLVISGAQELYAPGSNYFRQASDYLFVHTVFAAIAIVGIFLGWKSLTSSKRIRLNRFFASTRPQDMVPLLFAMLILSVVAMYLYTSEYDGFLGYFSYNRLVRSGHFELFDKSSWSFLKPFGGFAHLSAIGFWGLILSKRRSLIIYIGFLLAFLMSVYVLFAFSGRLSVIVFFSIFPVSIALYRRTSPLAWSIILPASAPLVLMGIFVISEVFSLKASDDFQRFAAWEISFPFIGFFAQIKEGNTFHFFYNLVLSPLHLFPSSIIGSWLSTASQINTETIHGAVKGTSGVTSAMPVDLITFGLMQFHFVGVLLYGLFFGWTLRAITCISDSFSLRGVASAFTAYVAIRIGIFGALYADPKQIIEGNFAFIATLLALVAVRAFRVKRK